MPRRTARFFPVLAAALAAIVMAGCDGDPTSSGPRIITLVSVTGSGQQGVVGSLLTQPFVVQATDQLGVPLPGLTVSWQVISGGGSVTPSQSQTGADGRASTLLRLGADSGSQVVSAIITGVQPVSFSVFAQADTTSTGGPGQPPPPPPAMVSFQTIAAGDRHTCGLTTDDVNYCWGFNGDGQLGIGVPPLGSGPLFAFPQPVMAVGNLTFRQAIGSRFHSCALTLSGLAHCWGTNVDGRLGDGTVTPRNEPVQVVTSQTFSSISPGRLHTCGVTLANRARCWGFTQDGALGVGMVAGDSLLIPGVVAEDTIPFRTVSSGRLHTCGLTPAGVPWCWGDNQSGQLGDGTATRAMSPVQVIGGLVFDSVSSGGTHSCALTPAGSAFCWGGNASGQLGNGSGAASAVPVPVSGGVAFRQISSGLDHTCGVSTSNALFCWGANGSGQLGLGNTGSSSTPTLVAGPVSGFTMVSAGATHTCGMGTDGIAYCWGDNQFAQVGDSTTTRRLVPTRVSQQK